LISISVLVAACGGGTGAETTAPETTGSGGGGEVERPEPTSTTSSVEEEETGSEAAEAASGGDAGNGECTITVTGDIEDTIIYPQSVFTFSSDYWASEEQKRDIVEFLGEDNVGGSYEDLVARGEPFVGWFLYNCVDPEDAGAGVIVLPTNETSSDQFPMGPGTYEVTGGLFDTTGPEATVITSFAVTTEEQFEPVPGSGELVISRWDTEALEGTIGFDAVESFAEGEAREVNVMVEFTVQCSPGFHGVCS
jgi:hypothetical protein